ncbi:hypothetical protein BT63DRAFT_421278 [Microthyrium microscopicum]|uniref:RBR-type E3 ubiquitin transferase n=1 Tax=Microthyrium microscopicum TaxID=703497 RepID=A0A6A6UMR9_9PEZI|nr:hypothetical protein BT63DRAFT_421278 [Microthyrium microscopicum]
MTITNHPSSYLSNTDTSSGKPSAVSPAIGPNNASPSNMHRQRSEDTKRQPPPKPSLITVIDIRSWPVTKLKIVLDDLKQLEHAIDPEATPRLTVNEYQIRSNLISLMKEFQNTVCDNSFSPRSKTERLKLYQELSSQLYTIWERNNRTVCHSCVVCGEVKKQHHFNLPPTERCSHPNRCCRDCLSKWTTTQFESQGWDHIRCPECPEILGRYDFKEVAPKSIYKKYKSLRNRSILSSDPDWHWCLSSKCNAGKVHCPSLHGPKYVCDKCGHKACITHMTKWHSNEDCVEFDDRVTGKTAQRKRDAENASERWKGKQAKLCYHCDVVIHKISGCNAMHCTNCNKSFDWAKAQAYRPTFVETA